MQPIQYKNNILAHLFPQHWACPNRNQAQVPKFVNILRLKSRPGQVPKSANTFFCRCGETIFRYIYLGLASLQCLYHIDLSIEKKNHYIQIFILFRLSIIRFSIYDHVKIIIYIYYYIRPTKMIFFFLVYPKLQSTSILKMYKWFKISSFNYIESNHYPFCINKYWYI